MVIKKYLTCFLILALLQAPLLAQTKAEKKASQEAARVAQIKAAVQGFGTGEDALIEVKLKNGTKRKGYISETKGDAFVVADTAAASSYDVHYAEVAAVKPYKLPTNPGNKRMIVLGVVIAAAVTVLAILAYKHCKKLEREGKTCPVDENTY